MKKICSSLIYVSVFLIPFYFFRLSFGGIGTNIFEIFVLLSIFAFLIFKISCFTYEEIKWGRIWPYLFLILAGISAYLATDKTSAFGIFKGWFLVPILLYFLIINIFNKKNINYLSIPLFLANTIVSIWAVLQKLGIIKTLFYQNGDASFSQYLTGNFRIFGPFESPNFLAMFILPAFFLSFFIFELIQKKRFKILIGIFFVLPLIALILSSSRAGAVALIGGSLLYLLISGRKKFAISSVMIASLIVAIVFGFVAWIAFVGIDPGSDSVRIEIYKYSIEILKSNWLFGIGLGEFQDKITQITKDALSFKTHALPYALHPHNIFLAMWLNLGLAGLIVFLILIFNFIKDAIGIKNPAKTILITVLSVILIHGLFDTTYYKNDLSAIFWLTFAILFINKNDKTKHK